MFALLDEEPRPVAQDEIHTRSNAVDFLTLRQAFFVLRKSSGFDIGYGWGWAQARKVFSDDR
jgi:hypothetical protein